MITYPDVSSFQTGLNLRGAPVALARTTEGDWFADEAYSDFRMQASRLNIPFAAYHFLEAGSSAEAQARWCHDHAAGAPLMLDWEPISASSARAPQGHTMGSSWGQRRFWGVREAGRRLTGGFISKPGVDKARAFVRRYRQLGGVCWLNYLPEWYWEILGRPSLEPFRDLGMTVVSSNYSAISGGAGWKPYGGMRPGIWQFTDQWRFNGMLVDGNLYERDAAAWSRLVNTGTAEHSARNPVAGLKCDVRFTQVGVSWQPAQHAVSYLVRAHQAGRAVAEVRTSTASATLKGLAEGATYRVTVWAHPGTGSPAELMVTTKT